MATPGVGCPTLDRHAAAEIAPGRTTISIDACSIGRRAGALLRERLSGVAPQMPQQAIDLELILRGSV